MESEWHPCWLLKRRWSATNLSSENNLLPFRLNAPIVIKTKVKKCHALLRIHVIQGQRFGCPSLPTSSSQCFGNQELPVLHPSWSAPLRVSSGCAQPPSPIAPVLYRGPGQWSPLSRLDGDSPTHALLQLTFPSFPACRHLGVPLSSSPVSVWSPWCRPGLSCRGYWTLCKHT